MARRHGVGDRGDHEDRLEIDGRGGGGAYFLVR